MLGSESERTHETTAIQYVEVELSTTAPNNNIQLWLEHDDDEDVSNGTSTWTELSLPSQRRREPHPAIWKDNPMTST